MLPGKRQRRAERTASEQQTRKRGGRSALGEAGEPQYFRSRRVLRANRSSLHPPASSPGAFPATEPGAFCLWAGGAAQTIGCPQAPGLPSTRPEGSAPPLERTLGATGCPQLPRTRRHAGSAAYGPRCTQRAGECTRDTQAGEPGGLGSLGAHRAAGRAGLPARPPQHGPGPSPGGRGRCGGSRRVNKALPRTPGRRTCAPAPEARARDAPRPAPCTWHTASTGAASTQATFPSMGESAILSNSYKQI